QDSLLAERSTRWMAENAVDGYAPTLQHTDQRAALRIVANNGEEHRPRPKVPYVERRICRSPTGVGPARERHDGHRRLLAQAAADALEVRIQHGIADDGSGDAGERLNRSPEV